MASAAGVQGADTAKIADQIAIIPSDFLKDIGTATSSATSAISAGDWGQHNNTIDMAGGTSLSFKQVALFGGLTLLGWFIVKKIKGA